MDSSGMEGTANDLQRLSSALADVVERAGRSIVAIHARRRIPSSGVIWRRGVLVTAHHTLHRDDELTLTAADGRTLSASLVGRDPSTDLAVLSVDDGAGDPAPLAGDEELRVGALVVALGRPGPRVTANLGLVASLGPEWRTWQGGRIDRLIRLDISVQDGFSGGPLVAASGAVLGLNSSALSRASAMSIPASTVDRVVDQLVRDGRIARGYVGIGVQPVRLPEELVERLGLDGDIALIAVSVEPGGPAERAGLFLGDVLISVGGARIADPAELLALLGPDAVGQTRDVRLLRAGKVETVPLTIGERLTSDPGSGRGRRGRRR